MITRLDNQEEEVEEQEQVGEGRGDTWRQKALQGEEEAPQLLAALPAEVLLLVAGRLAARDVSALGACSRQWRAACRTDELWAELYRRRWATDGGTDVDSGSGASPGLLAAGARAAYQARVAHVSKQAQELAHFIAQAACHDSLEVTDYHKAMLLLASFEWCFADTVAALFQPGLSVLANLLGLHYAAFHLDEKAHHLADALDAQHIGERQICLRWWSMGSMGRVGFRLRDEMHVSGTTLRKLAGPSHRCLLAVLQRGTVHEVLRVQISADFTSSAWVARDMHSTR